jgi:hypothetical protein
MRGHAQLIDMPRTEQAETAVFATVGRGRTHEGLTTEFLHGCPLDKLEGTLSRIAGWAKAGDLWCGFHAWFTAYCDLLRCFGW